MPVCRVSRFINEVMIRFGLAYVQCEGGLLQGRSGMVWDRANKIWFPKVLVLTDEFYKICGANIERLHIQRDQLLMAKQNGLIKEGEIVSIRSLRQLKRNMIFMKAWDSRKEGARAKKNKIALAGKSLDERRYDIALSLSHQIAGDDLASMSYDRFNKLIWQRLNSMNLGVINQSKSKH